MEYKVSAWIENGKVKCASQKCSMECPRFWVCIDAKLIIEEVAMAKTFKEFKQENKGGYYLYDAKDKKSLYGNCDNMIVVDYLYQPLNGIYTVYLKEQER